MAVHQGLDLRVPTKDICQFVDGFGQISQLHVVGFSQGPSFKGPDWITVQQETRNCGLHSVYQAGEGLDLGEEEELVTSLF